MKIEECTETQILLQVLEENLPEAERLVQEMTQREKRELYAACLKVVKLLTPLERS